jgi:hypothetical protein
MMKSAPANATMPSIIGRLVADLLPPVLSIATGKLLWSTRHLSIGAEAACGDATRPAYPACSPVVVRRWKKYFRELPGPWSKPAPSPEMSRVIAAGFWKADT